VRLHDAAVHLQRVRIVVYYEDGPPCGAGFGYEPVLIERPRQLGQLDRLGEIVQLQYRSTVRR